MPILLFNKELVKENAKPYYLLIYSTTPRFTKLSIYPVDKIPIIKYSIKGTNIQHDTIEEMLSILKNESLTILHTSGILLIDKIYYYELYLSDVHEKNISFFKNEITDIKGINVVDVTIISLKKHSSD
jgi:hypothetical protein